jgi:hypothetical protein
MLAHVSSTNDFCRRTKLCTQLDRDVEISARVDFVGKSPRCHLPVTSNPVTGRISTSGRLWAHYVWLKAYHEKPVISIVLVYEFIAVQYAQLATYQNQHR